MRKRSGKGLIERKTSLGEQSRFDLYSRIDRARAIEFAKREGFYSSLIRYYSRKINLWREFKREGVTVKRVKKDIKVELRLA